MDILKNIKKIHFIGIGGIGMSGLAQLLIKSGYKVNGSDIKRTKLVRKLEDLNINIYIGHNNHNIEGVDLVIYSSSIPSDNPELIAAKSKNIPVISRGKMLAELMNQKKGIAVTGTHGKTTTSSLLSYILYKAGLSPTIAVGAEIPLLGGNAYLGDGEYFVAEADESDGSFLHLSPFYSIITNIEKEHLDYYDSIDDIIKAYSQFAQHTKKDGCLFAYRDDKNVEKVINNYKNEVITFGLNDSSEIFASDIKTEGLSSKFKCFYRGNYIDSFLLNIPGIHNVINSLSAIAVCLKLNIGKNIIKEALSLYNGAKRRFQIKGTINNVTIIEDYAHHPTEIKATLEAARGLKPERIIVIFQPHRYTRTRHFKNSFSTSLNEADYLILTNIYPASEKAIEGINSKIIYDLIVKKGHKSVHLLPRQKITDHLLKVIKPKDMILVLGAGDIGEVSDELVKGLKEQSICK